MYAGPALNIQTLLLQIMHQEDVGAVHWMIARSVFKNANVTVESAS
jgi:hypothetical protein